MYCKHCGASNPDNAVFCGECGKPITSQEGEHKRTNNLFVHWKLWILIVGIVAIISTSLVIGRRLIESGRSGFSSTAGPTSHAPAINPTAIISPSPRPPAINIPYFGISPENATEVKQERVLNGHTGLVHNVAFSPDGRFLASGSFDGTVRLWNVEDDQLLRIIKHSDEVYSIAFSPDGNVLASGTSKKVWLWDVNSGNLIRTLEGHIGNVYGVVFSPDGSELITAGGDYNDDTVRLWDVNTGKLLNILENTDGNPFYNIAFSPDGLTIAAGSIEKVLLWDVNSYQLIRTLNGHNYFDQVNVVTSVAFSPNGYTLAAAGDGAVLLWNVKTGDLSHSLTGQIIDAEGVAFSPDGRILASTDNDGTVRLWDTDKGQLINILRGHSDWAFGVAFSPDGSLLASASRDRSIILWGLQP